MAVIYIIPFTLLVFGVLNLEGTLTVIEEVPKSAKLGGSANLTCREMTNYKNSVLSFNNTKIKETPGKFERLPNGAFQIKDIQPRDTGNYKYRQISDDSTHKNHCVINLKITEETLMVQSGSLAILKCKVSVPLIVWNEVGWRRKSTILTNNGSLSESAEQIFSGRLSVSWKTLTISNSRESDTGKYACIVLLKGSIPQRETYYINLVVQESSTILPRTTVKGTPSSGRYTSNSSSGATTGAPKHKSLATSLSSSIRVAVFVSEFGFLVLSNAS